MQAVLCELSNTAFLFFIQSDLIHLEIMTFDPDNPSMTAM